MSIETLISELTKSINYLNDTIRESSILPDRPPATTEKVQEEAPKEKPKKKKKRRTKPAIEAEKEMEREIAELEEENSIYDLPELNPAPDKPTVVDAPDEDESIFNMDEAKPKEVVPEEIPTLEQLRAEAAVLVDMDDSEKQLGLKAALSLMKKCGANTLKEVQEEDRAGLIRAFKQEVKTWPKKR